MKRKNGFIAISLLYSFFLCFIALMMGLLANYSHSYLILSKLNEPLTYTNNSLKSTFLSAYPPIVDGTVDFSKFVPSASGNSGQSGLYISEDDDGTSYYLRGEISNNYVDIGTTFQETLSLYTLTDTSGKQYTYNNELDARAKCDDFFSDESECHITVETQVTGGPLLWRIVRINGDNTIRLIADYGVGVSAFNNSNNSNFSGSSIEDALEEWYTMTIVRPGLGNLIAEASYCNNTSNSISSYSPSLECRGNSLKLKVGLLSADELVMAGIVSENPSSKISFNNYLYSSTSSEEKESYAWWTMSPYTSSAIYAAYAAGNSGIISYNTDENYVVIRPVINLKAEVEIIDGNGTSERPYRIYLSS